jgi:twitching motility protein PilT
VEVLLSTARVRECIIEKDKTNEINDAIAKGYTNYQMQSFDQSLMSLLNDGLITYEEALKHCSNPDDFALRVKGILATSDTTWDDFEGGKERPKDARPGRPAPPRPGSGGVTGSKR